VRRRASVATAAVRRQSPQPPFESCEGSPEGEQLAHIAEILEYEMFCSTLEFDNYTDVFDDMGVFWDWCSIYQKQPTLFDANEVYTESYTPEFFGGEAYEKSRTPEQKAAFGYALENTMDLWYAHQCTTVIFVTQLPDAYTGYKYDDRGWTTFERCCAELIKPSQAFANDPDDEDEEGRTLWHMCVDSQVLTRRQAKAGQPSQGSRASTRSKLPNLYIPGRTCRPTLK